MSEENKLITERRQKLQHIREQQEVAFPNQFRRSHVAAKLHTLYDQYDKDTLAEKDVPVKVIGRMMSQRLFGKGGFAVLRDVSGDIQLFVQLSSVGEDTFEAFKGWDVGDIIAGEGVLFKTKTNELSVKVHSLHLVTKSLRPLPEKFHGLSDQETRYRRRYVDLIMNADSAQVFKTRSKLISELRRFMEKHDFLEVETPMMHVIPGGAAAKPFTTHHNALDLELYLRVAPELFLKRLVVGGFEKVFEINRNFRNEGVSTKHNPEFTMMEFYWAYSDYLDLMDLTEILFKHLAETVLGKTVVPYQGIELDFSKPFARETMTDLVVKYSPDLTQEKCNNLSQLQNYFEQQGIGYDKNASKGHLIAELFDIYVEDKLIQPTFVTQYPIEISPLSRRSDDNPEFTDRFELFISGHEIANGFSELNDPEDQAERFHQQVANLEAGDDEAMHYDKDYVRALEYGMPPTAGEGIGIDRLVMLFTDSASIRDVLLFPYMKPE
ncbi:lysine--tRNA ligase [Marinicella gelatinilytica]|uniref:lysine--tRNA ligase n=1 Tax=Marinicella gelatinilytica TaxID=2996017 RepID=UPI002260FEBC|nr:lysine--tRNA ligase [Marinicella gelatinilytica]MCX7545769.1 lysine--tRNA ligase [Marinicella gelatinilytica]